jgi:hypothetical protein
VPECFVRLSGLALDHAECLQADSKFLCAGGTGLLFPHGLPLCDERFQLRFRGVEPREVEREPRRPCQGGGRCEKAGKIQLETHAGSEWENSLRVKCKFFPKIWKSLNSTAIGVGMTSIANNAETTTIQAPGGARVGTAPLAHLPPTGETKSRSTKWTKLMEPNQSGGTDDTLRSIRVAGNRSPQNGTTVACRGAGQSARISFCLSMIAFIETGKRTPGGIRHPKSLLC